MPEDEIVSDAEVEVSDLSNVDVLTKQKEAAGIANKTLAGLLGFCKPGQKIVSSCAFGDTLIKKQCEIIFKSKNIEKGVAFPTCISVNEIVCHYSPLDTDSKDVVFAEGDIIKIDLGVFIDGFIAVAAKSFICSADNNKPDQIEGRKADIFTAAYTALEGCTKLMKEGVDNTELTSFISKVADCYDVTPVQGVLMHQLKRFVIDGNEVIINKIDPDHKVDSFKFELHKVYTLDIVFSTGSGKPIQSELRTTVFKRAIDKNYNLKMKAARQLFHKMQTECGTLPFTIRGLAADEKTAKLGIVECMKHSLVNEYPVLIEKDVKGEKPLIVHLKATVCVMKSGTVRITSVQGLESIKTWVKSAKTPTDEIKEVLSRSAKNKKKKAKK